MSRDIIRCRYCGSGMLADMEICPNCGARNRLILYNKWWFWMLLGIALVAVGILIL